VNFSPEKMETWMPIAAIALAAVSWLLHRHKSTPHPMTLRETVSNVAIFVVWRFIFFAGGLALQYAIFSAIAARVPWKIGTSPAIFPLAILLADFCYYWKHRYEHETSVLWAQHSVHHSSEEFNLSTSLRLPWVGSYLNWMFFIPALLLGFSAKQIILGHQMVLTYQYLVHTEFVGKLGFLERILNTPSHHRVHHSRNDRYLDKNYGGILIIWDRWFGTFAPEESSIDFGVTHPIGSENPWTINFKPWRDLYEAIRKIPGWDRRIGALFSKPGDLERYAAQRYIVKPML
jgi:sterol desaturase/sphingolipid hydroxylase (fatty acid hydroxylase superfamily)